MQSKLLFFVCFLIVCMPIVVFGDGGAADNGHGPVVPPFIALVGIPGVDPNDHGLGTYINAIYRLSISLAALLAVVKIVIAGAKYMLDDIVTHKEEAKQDIWGAIMGLLVILGAVLLLTTINSDLTRTDLLIDQVVVDDSVKHALPTELQVVCGADGKQCTKIVCNPNKGLWWFVSDIIDRPACTLQCIYYNGVWEAEPGTLDSGTCVYANSNPKVQTDREAALVKNFSAQCKGALGCSGYICSTLDVEVGECESHCAGKNNTYIPEYNGCLIAKTVNDSDERVVTDVAETVIKLNNLSFTANNIPAGTFTGEDEIHDETLAQISTQLPVPLDHLLTPEDVLSISTLTYGQIINNSQETYVSDLTMAAIATGLQSQCIAAGGTQVAYDASATRTDLNNRVKFYCVK